MPPLSASVQQTVNEIVSDLVSNHSGDTVSYSGVTGGSLSMGVSTGLYKIHMKNGIITAVEPDDSLNPGVPREDSVLTPQQIIQGHLQSRIKANGYTFPLYMYAPDRILYPMQRISARGEVNGAQFVRITWQQAMDSLANMLSTTMQKYGPYSGVGVPEAAYVGMGVSTWGDVSFGAEDTAEAWILGANGLTVFPAPIPQPKGGVTTSVNVNDVFNTKAIILWGWDPTTSGGSWSRNLL